MDWPTVSVLIPTFQRHFIVARTVELFQKNLIYAGQLEFIVSEDGPVLPVIDLPHVRVVKGPGRGLGGNQNALLAQSESEIVLQSDDDFWLVAPLWLDAHVRTLLTVPEIGWIKLMYLADHNYTATLRGMYWWLYWASPELYIPSNRAHLKHRRFHAAFGLYPENEMLAATENTFCAQCKALAQTPGPWPQVVVPLGMATENSWLHVGQSYQKQGY